MNDKKKTGITHLIILIIGILIGFYIGSEVKESQYRNHCIEKGGSILSEDGLCMVKVKEIVFQGKDTIVEDTDKTNPIEEELDDTTDEDENTRELSHKTSIIAVPQYNGEKFGYTIKKISYTPQVLNETYKELFNEQGDNSGTWNGLRFVKVEIDPDTHVARVYLIGNWRPVGDMSGGIMRALIDSASFYYPHVDKVEVFMNDEKFDWCIDDESEGESGCNQSPKYWEDTRGDYENLKRNLSI